MKGLKRALALVMASALACSLFAFSASAEGENENNENTDATKTTMATTPITQIGVSKTITVAAGAVLPTETFKLKMVPATAAEVVDSNGDPLVVGNLTVHQGKALTKDTVEYTVDSKTDTSTGSVVLNTEYFNLSDVKFDETGLYRYYVYEEQGTDTYITYDTHRFEVDVYVISYSKTETVKDDATGESKEVTTTYNGIGCYVVKQLEQIISEVVDEEGNKTQVISYSATGQKPTSINFTNIVSTADIVISKTVVGTEVVTGQDYTFYIRIPAGGDTIALKAGDTVHAEIWNATGKVKDNDITIKKNIGDNGTAATDEAAFEAGKVDFTNDDYSQSFTLKDGEYLKIPNAPVSMIYYVAEDASYTADGYTQTYVYTETGNRTTDTRPTDADSTGNLSAVVATTKDGKTVNVSKLVHGTTNTGTNRVDFTNTRNISVGTGISLDVIPYVLVAVIAACGAILLISEKKRRTNR
jgi:hypothetical protein